MKADPQPWLVTTDQTLSLLKRERFPAAEFRYVPGAGHWVHSQKPKEFLDLLIPFLARQWWHRCRKIFCYFSVVIYEVEYKPVSSVANLIAVFHPHLFDWLLQVKYFFLEENIRRFSLATEYGSWTNLGFSPYRGKLWHYYLFRPKQCKHEWKCSFCRNMLETLCPSFPCYSQSHCCCYCDIIIQKS